MTYNVFGGTLNLAQSINQYMGSGSGSVSSEVVVKQTWHGLVVADQISVLRWRSDSCKM